MIKFYNIKIRDNCKFKIFKTSLGYFSDTIKNVTIMNILHQVVFDNMVDKKQRTNKQITKLISAPKFLT